jgi:hypothetical protein
MLEFNLPRAAVAECRIPSRGALFARIDDWRGRIRRDRRRPLSDPGAFMPFKANAPGFSRRTCLE